MNNYHKGVSIETLKEETQLQKDSIPGIITVEPDILEHYLNYIRRKCFPTMGHILAEDQEENFNQKYFHLLPDGR